MTVPRFSMVQASVASRLAVAGGLSVLVWLAVLWASAPIVPAVLP
ncbi:hypothetical protein [Pinisolibacter aquiterrae]|nr:hypothetical protein [Pinisolibacter aquiterrae]